MARKFISILIFILFINSYSKINNNVPRINIPLLSKNKMVNASTIFVNNFRKITGENLRVERSNNLNKKYSYILLRINPTQKDNFCTYLDKEKNLIIAIFFVV